MRSSPVVPRPASTLVLARDGLHGIEVFMMQRTHQAEFLAGAYVFPGGGLDRADSDASIVPHCTGLDDASASRSLKLESGGLAFWVAAIRECFEESGLLLAYDEHGDIVRLDDPPVFNEYAGLRKKLIAGDLTMAGICHNAKLRLAVDRLAYFGHWITPIDRPKRYDTRFFVAVAPACQTGSADDCETIDHVWIRPADALERQSDGRMNLAFATIRTLELLAQFPDTATLVQHARTLQTVTARTPRAATAGGGRRMLLPDDPAYAEVAKLDTTGSGTVSCELLPGTVTWVSGKVRRITAPNASFMTGPGTNTYLLGNGDDVALIDPGPASEEHLRFLLAEAKGRIRWIFVTHTHIDHSPAAAILKAQTDAQLFGMQAAYPDRQDSSFVPDTILAHGDRVGVAGCTLRVIHTPGHASNHLCYLLEDEQLLFTGDHIMQGSTVIINPPDGDMGAYLASLRLLSEEEIAYLAPGHGFLMDKPHEVIERLLAHRLARENKLLATLRRQTEATVAELVPFVYDDVPAKKHAAASRSLLAHLLKLKADGYATEVDGRWRAVELRR
jgi:glyoxylase-like metal-dependent hydrolase (beta-lactamase superfamily II)/8-oxo-dGTP pyrophosphatase MutT (NUDIX family)